MLTSSSCFGARVGCVVRGAVCGAALCAARRVLAWRAGLGTAVLCCPPRALFGLALVALPACCGRPLCVPLGAVLGGWWFRCPAPTDRVGAGLSVRLSPFVGWGCGRK